MRIVFGSKELDGQTYVVDGRLSGAMTLFVERHSEDHEPLVMALILYRDSPKPQLTGPPGWEEVTAAVGDWALKRYRLWMHDHGRCDGRCLDQVCK
ncbi:hypothetical protein IW245_003673 [Longispora fulva]|uniref:Uncharacterized protein n=1 Tax=Longispora fulva TaxID=619741 RepID=A0A8J7KK03_9ACTN|nr:hypothetical protein [Longispora fulva]